MNKLLLLMFAFSVSLAVSAQKRGVLSTYKNLKAPRNVSDVLEINTFNGNSTSSQDVNIANYKGTFVTAKKRAVNNFVDTSLFFDLKQRYATAGPSGFTIQPYLSANSDSLEVTVLSQTIHNSSKSKYTLNGVGLVLGSRNKGSKKSDVNVKVYDAQSNVIASSSNTVPYTTANGLGLYYFVFDNPVTTTEDVTFYIEGKSAYDTIRVYTSGAYRNLAISCNITGNTMTLVTNPANANVGSGFWTGQEISGVGILPGTKIASYNSTSKVYTLSQSATDGSNIVVTGKSLTFDEYKNSAIAEYYKFPLLSDNQPDLTQAPSYDASLIHGISGVPTDGHVVFYPLVEYSFENSFTASNKCLGNSNEVIINDQADNSYFAIAKNPILNKMAFYTFLNNKVYYHGISYTTSKSFMDTLFQASPNKITYNASDLTVNDSLIVGNYLWKYGYKKPITQPSGFSNLFILSSKINLATTVDSAKNKSSVDGKAAVVATGGVAPYTYLWSNNEDTTDIVVAAGEYSIAVTDNNGCSAIDTVNVPFMATSTSNTTVTACLNYKWNDSIYTESGSYTFVTKGIKGNDSIATLNLTLNQPTFSSETKEVCDSLNWNNVTYKTSGTYKFTTTNAKGCDSIVTLNLTINQSTSSTTTITANNSYEWNGKTYENSGIYKFNTTNAKGCDSTATLVLTVNAPGKSTTIETACDSFTWNDSVYVASGTYVFNTKGSVGNDSTATLLLTINKSDKVTLNEVACGSYTWNDSTYTASGSYVFNGKNVKGCDSIVTLNLTINQPSASTVNEVACGSYTWKDSTFTKSGVYTLKTLNVNGCDSTITLNLTINQPSVSTVTEVVCGSFDWNGTKYEKSGSYEFKTKNANGCDSIVTLNLTINQPSVSTVTEVACGSFDWNGTKYEKSGSYEFKTKNAKGCDSIVTLNLTINQPAVSTVTEVACGSFNWNGTKYEKSGSYEFKTKTSKGCDSIVTLNLTINAIPSVTASLDKGSLVASVANATYQWLNCDANNVAVANETKQTFLPTTTGNYAVKVSSNGCEATSACVKFEASTTGLVDANQVAFSIYPNPNQGIFNIAGLPTGTYKIMNLMGAEVFQFTVESTDAQLLNLSHLAKGVYQVTSDAVKIMHNKVVITD